MNQNAHLGNPWRSRDTRVSPTGGAGRSPPVTDLPATGWTERSIRATVATLYIVPHSGRLRAPFSFLVSRSRLWSSIAIMAAKKLTMAKPKHPGAHRTNVERHVSWRIRERRIMLGMTQQHLAERLGLSYQQVHNYETGVRRIAAGILDRIAKTLGVDVGLFYEGLGEANERTGRPRAILLLLRDFTNLTDSRQQQALLCLSRALTDADPGHDDNVEAADGGRPME